MKKKDIYIKLMKMISVYEYYPDPCKLILDLEEFIRELGFDPYDEMSEGIKKEVAEKIKEEE